MKICQIFLNLCDLRIQRITFSPNAGNRISNELLGPTWISNPINPILCMFLKLFSRLFLLSYYFI